MKIFDFYTLLCYHKCMCYLLNFEINILEAIRNSLSCGTLDGIMKFLSAINNHGEIWLAAALVMLLLPKYRRMGAGVLSALLLEVLLCSLFLKPLVGRMRPFTANPSASLIIPPPDDFSFPSGHTASSFAAATAIFIRNKRLGAAAFILSALVGFSRLYLYVHYPTDVLCGAALGLLSALISDVFINKFLSKKGL